MTAPDPLSARVYLARSFRRVLPEWLAMSLVTVLLIVVITPSNTFRETTLANLRSLEVFTAVTPARKPGFDSALTSLLEANPAMERRVRVKVGWIRYPMLIGEAICPLVLLDSMEASELLQRVGLELVAGRLPRDGAAEVVLHEDVARAEGLEIGSRTGTQVDRNEVDGLFEVVGLLRGGARLGVGTTGSDLLSRFLDARLPSYMLIYAEPDRKAVSDAYLHQAWDHDTPAFRVVDMEYVRERSAEALKNLPALVTFLTVATSLVVALVVALLKIIGFQARADEFAILLAIGHPPRRLARKLAAECALLAVAAWTAGVAAGELAMVAYDRYVLAPRGIVMQVMDLDPVLLSLTLPVIAIAASVFALWRKLRALDPLSVIERRFA